MFLQGNPKLTLELKNRNKGTACFQLQWKMSLLPLKQGILDKVKVVNFSLEYWSQKSKYHHEF